jgi:hypothetical protein
VLRVRADSKTTNVEQAFQPVRNFTPCGEANLPRLTGQGPKKKLPGSRWSPWYIDHAAVNKIGSRVDAEI